MTYRIAMITPRFAPFIGGVESHVENLALALASRGHDLHVFTQRTDRRSARAERRGGIEIARYVAFGPTGSYPVSVPLWRAVYRDRRHFDIIHAHCYHAVAAVGARYAATSGRPFVFTPHYHGVGHTAVAKVLHRLYRPLGDRVMGAAGRVLCVSESEQKLIYRDFGADVGDRSEVIPNAVDVDAIRAAQPFPSHDPLVLCVGRLATYKNVATVVRAARLLPPAMTLSIVGDGPLHGELSALVAAEGGGARVRLHGAVDEAELHRLYRTATVCVSVSRHEAFGIALLEAIAGGANVVASSIPAHREVAGLSGADVKFVAPDVTPASLALAIREAAAGGRSRTMMASVPGWPEVAKRTECAYARAMAASGDSRSNSDAGRSMPARSYGLRRR